MNKLFSALGTVALTLILAGPSLISGQQAKQPPTPTQQAAPAVPQADPAPPQLTTTEQIAISTLITEQSNVQKREDAVFRDIAEHHPGFHLDPRSLTLQPDPKPIQPKHEEKAPAK